MILMKLKESPVPKASYHLIHPSNRNTSVIFASPHSGRDYSWNFLRRTVLDELTIRSSEDAFVDRLFDSAPDHGAVFLKAGAPRAFVDLNRAADELDPALIDGVPKRSNNPRIATGLGVIPRVVANGRSIYHGKMDMGEVRERLDVYWRPYHTTLRRLISENHTRFGQAVLIDCHSMPHEAVAPMSKTSNGMPDIVIGDRFGASASAEIVDRIESIFADAGFKVSRNAPFAGAYIVRQYGRPSMNQHAIQIEIDRSIYMDEALVKPNGNFAVVRAMLKNVTRQIADIGRAQNALAAE